MACVAYIGVPPEVAWLSKADLRFMLDGLPDVVAVNVMGRLTTQDWIMECGQLFARRSAIDEAVEHEKARAMQIRLDGGEPWQDSFYAAHDDQLDNLSCIAGLYRKPGESDDALRRRVLQEYRGRR